MTSSITAAVALSMRDEQELPAAGAELLGTEDVEHDPKTLADRPDLES